MIGTNGNNLVQSQLKAHQNKMSLDRVDVAYDEYFRQLSKLQKGDVIVQPNCKFCHHPGRADAEEIWERTASYAPVERFFKKYLEEHPESPTSPKMYWSNIKTHLLAHYERQQKKIWLREYGDRVKLVINRRISDEHRLSVLSQQLEMQLNDVAADPEICPIKQSGVMVQLTKMIVDIALTLAKLRGELQTVNVVTDKFTSVWFKVISAQEDENVKRLLLDSLDAFQEELEGVPISPSE